MSGLCGIIDATTESVSRSDVEAMAAAAPYRGMDGGGAWSGRGAAFVYQASHITPQSEREQQPYVDDASGLVVLADARIDNRTELLTALRASNRPLAVDVTDLEIVAAAFLTWGDEAAERLIGDFAIVTWHPGQRRLFAVLDPMGLRTLAYRSDGSRVTFATEVQQVLAAPGVSVRLFEPAIAAHLLSSFEHPEWTPYEGVFRLMPGHALIVEGGRSSVRRTWDIDPGRRTGLTSEADHVSMFRTLFTQAVDARLRSQRAVGALLSGGVDSGSVAATAGTILHERGADPAAFRTYSWAFEDLHEIDERHVSRHIVDHFGFTSRDVMAERSWPLSGDPMGDIPREGPFCSVYGALIKTALDLARRDGVGLMLVGLRGDLVVGETVYDTVGLLLRGRFRDVWHELRAYRRWRRTSLPSSIRHMLWRPIKASVKGRFPFAARHNAHVRTHRPPPPWVRHDFLARTDMMSKSVIAPHLPEGLSGEARRNRYRAVFSNFGVNAMAWSDKLHAEAGLAMADPWSDRRLAEFVIAMPQSMVQRLYAPKQLAREAMRGIVPEPARRSLAKVPPRPLYRRALERDAVSVIEMLLRDPLAHAMGYIDAQELRAHYEAVRSGARDHPGLWPVLSLELWLRAHHSL